MKLDAEFSGNARLASPQILNSGEGLLRNSWQARREGQMVGEHVDRCRVFYARRTAERGAYHRLRRRRGVVMRKAGIDMNEACVVRFDGAMPGCHMASQDFLSDRHWPRSRVDGFVRLAALGASLHESEESTVTNDAF